MSTVAAVWCFSQWQHLLPIGKNWRLRALSEAPVWETINILWSVKLQRTSAVQGRQKQKRPTNSRHHKIRATSLRTRGNQCALPCGSSGLRVYTRPCHSPSQRGLRCTPYQQLMATRDLVHLVKNNAWSQNSSLEPCFLKINEKIWFTFITNLSVAHLPSSEG